MEIIAAVKNAIKDMIVPELDKIKADVGEIKAILDVTNKRINDMSRRIDKTNSRIDETNRALGRLYEVIVRRDEHKTLEQKVFELERDVREIKIKIAV